MLDIQINGNVLQIFTDSPKIDLSHVDAFTYDRKEKILRVFENGVKVYEFLRFDSEPWKDIQVILRAKKFLKYQWASFKSKCIMNPDELNEELKVTFSDTTFVRP